MVGKKTCGLAEILAEGLDAENLTSLPFDGVGSILPDEFSYLLDAALSIKGMTCVGDEDAAPWDTLRRSGSR